MPKNLKGSFRVRIGNEHIRVSPYQTPGGKDAWRLRYQPVVGVGLPWKVLQFDTKGKATAKAEELLGERSTGFVWSALPSPRRRFLETVHLEVRPADEEAILAFIRARGSSSLLSEAVARFMEVKIQRKRRETDHLKMVRRDLEAMVSAMPGKAVVDVHFEELKAWWQLRGAGTGDARMQGIRGTLVMFWRWAFKEKLAGPDPVTIAERLASTDVGGGDRAILTPEQLLKLMTAVKPQYRPWVVLGAFAGIRPEEIAPKSGSGKEGLRCEHLDWQWKCINLPEHVSKVGVARIIPMGEALLVALEWAGIRPGMTGPVCPESPSEKRETSRLAKLLFSGKWPKDALRHSYGSYRNAILRDRERVIEEMGTSLTMFNRHYHNPQPEEFGYQWFAVRPPGAAPKQAVG